MTPARQLVTARCQLVNEVKVCYLGDLVTSLYITRTSNEVHRPTPAMPYSVPQFVGTRSS